MGPMRDTRPAARPLPVRDGIAGQLASLRGRGGDRAAAVAVAAAAFLTYANTLGHGFVFDDIPNIVQNRWIRSPRHLPEIFSTHVAGLDLEFSTSYYRPMMHVLYLAVYAVAGLRPFAFHLVNVLLHVLVSLLAFLAARSLIERLGPPARDAARSSSRVPLLTALLFATHPVHSEAVAWLAGITDLSFSVFGMLSVVTYLQAWRPRGSVAAAAWLLLACLSKEPALAIVLLLTTIELLHLVTRGGSVTGSAARMAPLAAAVAVYLALRWAALGGFAPSYGRHRYEASVSLLAAVQLFGQYIRKLVVPAPLNAWHVFQPPESLVDPGVLMGLAAGSSVLATAWLAMRQPLPLAGLAWTVAPLLPVLYAPVLGEGVFAERYLYFPSFGFTLLLASGWTALTARLRASGRAVLVILLVVVATTVSERSGATSAWRDHLSLWSDTVRVAESAAASISASRSTRPGASRKRQLLAGARARLRHAWTRGSISARWLCSAISWGGELDEALRQQPRSVQASRPADDHMATAVGARARAHRSARVRPQQR
jgi:hypothetical protein